MKEIVFPSKYFNARDTLECGQIFRFNAVSGGYLVKSRDKACFLKTIDGVTAFSCEDGDVDYFKRYFDLETDYEGINERAKNSGFEILAKAAQAAEGVRILKQDEAETCFSFLISQNNNIPRIKGIIEKLCDGLGKKREFCGMEYMTFPKTEDLKNADVDFYKSIGMGYRAEFFKGLAQIITDDYIAELRKTSGAELKKRLLSVRGIGDKVADCIRLFGFHKTDSFPVDVWIEKIYAEDFGGKLLGREKISEYFVKTFGFDSGFFQQYLFHYKRNLQND